MKLRNLFAFFLVLLILLLDNFAGVDSQLGALLSVGLVEDID